MKTDKNEVHNISVQNTAVYYTLIFIITQHRGTFTFQGVRKYNSASNKILLHIHIYRHVALNS